VTRGFHDLERGRQERQLFVATRGFATRDLTPGGLTPR